jgi:D-3-phosphoglycerate dehydrogenase
LDVLVHEDFEDADLFQKNTRHIIGKNEFAKMKDGVVIVNTARGAVMDEAALVEALDSGKVYSAGLDVFEEEPKIHPGLIGNPSVMLVPHMGTWTLEVSCAILRRCWRLLLGSFKLTFL